MKFLLLLFVSFSLLIIASCGDDSAQEAKLHLEAIRFDVYEPVDDAVSAQNDAIGEFMTRMKNREELDWKTEMGEIIELRSAAALAVDDALKRIESVPNFNGKNDLKQATITYLEKIAEFEKEVEPSLNGLKDGMDLVSMMKFSAQLKKGQELELASEAYKTAQKAFMKEHNISGLDVIKMQAGR
ncbi:MAG: hypothetical protein P8P74_13750 [Crocinitomicaceae bacterium]|nr:hypothetical protein [Crocinitomicaceae bacterium]